MQKRFVLRLAWGLVLLLFLLFFLAKSPNVALSQSSSPAFWRYDAPGRLNQVEVVDIDLDGIGEFIVVAGDTNIALVGSDGLPVW